MERRKGKLAVRDICLIGLMVAVIEACKFALANIPNVELTSFWLILFALCFGRHALFAVPVFILIEGAVYGFGLWWLMYLYAWPLLVFGVLLLRKADNVLTWSLLSGVFGLLFGLLCSVPYVFIGMTDGGLMNGLRAAFGYWIAGIPFDLIHGIANFVLMLVLYRPMKGIMQRAKNRYFLT